MAGHVPLLLSVHAIPTGLALGRFLLRQPFCIGPHIDHRDGGAALQKRDQFKQEGRRGFSQRADGMAPSRIARKHAMCSDAADIQAVIGVAFGKQLK